jgi:hypothetical protein
MASGIDRKLRWIGQKPNVMHHSASTTGGADLEKTYHRVVFARAKKRKRKLPTPNSITFMQRCSFESYDFGQKSSRLRHSNREVSMRGNERHLFMRNLESKSNTLHKESFCSQLGQSGKWYVHIAPQVIYHGPRKKTR